MNQSARHALKSAGKRLRLDKLFWYTYGVLQETEPDARADTIIGVFTDSHGDRIELLEGHRDRVVPGWRGMAQAPRVAEPPSLEAAQAKITSMRQRLARFDAVLAASSLSFAGSDVLEVGAHDGATAFALAEAGARSVVATDVAAYYITQSREGTVSEAAVTAKNAELARLREAHRASVDPRAAQRVKFVEDDICMSTLPDKSVDAVLTLEVLEHVLRPEDAFREMARVLRPGGFTFHEYNPFFSLNGGHSLFTLDFPWGHARLDEADLERYLVERRPGEKQVAMSFFRNNLNRMTFEQLRQHVERSGLRLLGLLPWTSEQHLRRLPPPAFAQCSRLYPSVEVADFVSPTAWLLLRKEA